MPRKFTKSKDGKLRCTVRVPIRLERESLELLQDYVDTSETPHFDSLVDLLSCELSLAVSDLCYRIERGEV